MIAAIVGSRRYGGAWSADVIAELRHLFRKRNGPCIFHPDTALHAGGEVTKVVSGGARGADSLGALVAAEMGIPVEVFAPDWERLGKSAGYRRNVQIVDAADEVFAFWDGKSRGTKHSIDIARKAGKPVHVWTDGRWI